MVDSFSAGDSTRDSASYGAGGLAGRGARNPRDTSQDNDPINRNRRRLGAGRQMMLPAEYADFVLADGRKLVDVLGKGFFQWFGGKGGEADAAARARRLAERRAQAGRLNQTRSVLAGAQGVAGAADIARRGLSGQ